MTHRNVADLHIAQAVRYRLWWLFPTAVLSGITEILGWSGRLWSSQNPLLRTPFLIQYVPPLPHNPRLRAYTDDEGDRVSTLVMAPTYLIATNFVILGKIIKWLGPQYCRMSQKWCEWLFSRNPSLILRLRAFCCRRQTQSCSFHA